MMKAIICQPLRHHRTQYQDTVKRFFASPDVNQWFGSSVVVTGVFPDDSASAAGVRTRFLMERLGQLAQESNFNHKGNFKSEGSVILTTTDKDWTKQDSSSSKGHKQHHKEQEHQQWIPNLKVEHLPMNRGEAVAKFLSRHEGIQRIVFDRFYIEEAFSHAFWETAKQNNTAMILDMQDMHSLRHGRQDLVRRLDASHRNEPCGQYDPLTMIPQVMDYLPTVDGVGKDNDRLLRELASIHRCDLTLVCSPFEMDLLQNEYGIPQDKLCQASFFVDPSSIIETNLSGINSDRAGDENGEETKFIFCGGFLHDPNVDAVNVLLKHIWPRLQNMIPDGASEKRISLHIHGAYCPEHILKANNPKNGVFVHGYTPRLQDIFDNQTGRNILLAPLRFGAGIKGKILDAWTNGMPVVTTPIGSEGIVEQKDRDKFGGAVCSTVDDFCENAVALMRNSDGCYSKAQKNCFRLLRQEFHAESNWNMIKQTLQTLDSPTLADRRRRDPVQAMLWHQSLRSTKYFSKWIEEKETKG